MELKRFIKERVLAPVLTCRVSGAAEVALTFDDGPEPERTPAVLRLLEQVSARATFFVVGEKARRHPELVTAIRAAGHQVGNHSMTHCDPTRLSWSRLAGEIDAVSGLADHCGQRLIGTAFYRPPRGALSAKLVVYCLVRGHRIVLWSVDTRDFQADDPAAVVVALERARPSASIPGSSGAPTGCWRYPAHCATS